MIATIIIVSLALYWLALETDYLRINLMIPLCENGACCHWHMPDTAVDDDMRHELIRSWTNLDKLTRARFLSGEESPLCGWGYAYQYRNYAPDCKVEMSIGNIRYNITFRDTKVIKDVMRVNHLTRKQKTSLCLI